MIHCEDQIFNADVVGISYGGVPIYERLIKLPAVFCRHWRCTKPGTPLNLRWFVAYELTKSYLRDKWGRILYKPVQ